MKKNARVVIALLAIGSYFMPNSRDKDQIKNERSDCGCGSKIDLSNIYDEEGDYIYEDEKNNPIQDSISEYSTDSESATSEDS